MKSVVDAIEQRRQSANIPVFELERVAQLSANYYYRLRNGEYVPSKEAVARLNLAINRLLVTPNVNNSGEGLMLNALIRTAIALICIRRGLDAEPIQQADANRRATASKEWAQAALVRNEAWALVNNAFGVAGADIARAAGVSKAAVSIALRKIEDMRDDPDYEQFHDRLERALTGGGW